MNAKHIKQVSKFLHINKPQKPRDKSYLRFVINLNKFLIKILILFAVKFFTYSGKSRFGIAERRVSVSVIVFCTKRVKFVR